MPRFAGIRRGRGLLLLLPGLASVLAILVVFAWHAGAPACLAAADPRYTWAIAPSRWLLGQTQAAFAAPGLVVAVTVDGQIVWSESFGLADLARQSPACPWTRFRIGSVSKPLTASAAALLVEQGRLDLDAPVQQYVPGFPDKGSAVTARHLLGHLSGIRHYRRLEEVLNRRHYDSVSAALTVFQDDPLLFPPGTRFAYSSYGYNLLGAVIEGAAGQDYLDFMSSHIFDPLDMKHTVADDPAIALGERATFYEDIPGGLAVAPYVDNSNKLPAAGYLSTPEDLARFGSALMRGELLAPGTVDLMFTPLCPDCPALGEREGTYGMGWGLDEIPLAGRRAYHTGASVGSSAAFAVYPDQGIALALAMNVGSVTNPAPQLHGLPLDPNWIIPLFMLARAMNAHPAICAPAGFLAIGLGLAAALVRKRITQRTGGQPFNAPARIPRIK